MGLRLISFRYNNLLQMDGMNEFIIEMVISSIQIPHFLFDIYHLLLYNVYV